MRARVALLLLIASTAWMQNPVRAADRQFINISPAGADISALVIDPSNSSILYVATSAGIYKSVDGGESWNLSLDSTTRTEDSFVERSFSALAIDPAHPSTLYAGTQTGEIFTTTDGGASWSPRVLSADKAAVMAVVVDPSTEGALFVLTPLDLWYSADGGLSWVSRRPPFSIGDELRSLAIDPSQPSRLYLGSRDLLYATSDRGLQWVPKLVGTVDRIAVDPGDSANLYVSLGSRLFSSRDMGDTWSSADLNGSKYEIVVDPKTSVVYAFKVFDYFGGESGTLTSTDRGLTWKEMSGSYSDARILAIDSTETHRFYGVDGRHLLQSDDFGIHWRRIDSGLHSPAITQVAPDPQNPVRLLASTASGVVQSSDGGKTWTDETLPLRDARLSRDPRNPSRVFAFTFVGAARSVDGGDTWNFINPGPGVGDIAVDPANSSVVYAALFDDISKSVDGGDTWSSTALGQVVNNSFYYYGFGGDSIVVDPLNSDTIYAHGDGGGTYASRDAGKTWNWLHDNSSGIGGRARVIVAPTVPSSVYLLGPNYLVRILDGDRGLWGLRAAAVGQTFTDLAFDPRRPSDLYLATTSGLLRSQDQGGNWTELNEGLPTGSISDVTVDSLGNVYAGTPRGLFVLYGDAPLDPFFLVSLKTHAGNFVSAANCGGSYLDANSQSAGQCETFGLYDLNGGTLNDGDAIHLRAAYGDFVAAEGGGGGAGPGGPVASEDSIAAGGGEATVESPLNANRVVPAEWETFIVHRLAGIGAITSGDSITLQSWNGSYVAAEKGGGNGCQCDSRLNANRSQAREWETFIITMR